ncbi:putative RWD domain-containing protein [Cryptosporidium felis]|nr:putative RWD domain-containing protein [Cryptosporidium felis]
MSGNVDCRLRLKQEIEALRCIFLEEGELLCNSELESWLLKQEESEENPRDLSLRVRLDERRFYSMPLYLEIGLDPENNYDLGPLRIRVVSSETWDEDIRAPFFLSDSQCRFIEDAAREAFLANTECIFDQIVASREAAEQVVQDIPCEPTVLDYQAQSSSLEDDEESFSDGGVCRDVCILAESLGRIKWGQRACYSHHIRSKIKRKLIVEWARELYIGGYCKIGYPGIIIVEGPEECCLEYTRRLQRLQWKHFVVRGEIVTEVRFPSCKDYKNALNSLRILPSSMVELPPEHMKILARICEELGIKDLFLTTMKIYPK